MGALVAVVCTSALALGACNGILGITAISTGNGDARRIDTAPGTPDTSAPDAFPCQAGNVCTSANQCHVSVTICDSNNVMSCFDTGTNKPDTTPCAGGTCTGGVCSDPCGNVTCGSPPANECNGTVATTYPNPGSCDSSSGSAVCSYPPSMTDCANSGQECVAGQCVSPPDAPFSPLPDA